MPIFILFLIAFCFLTILYSNYKLESKIDQKILVQAKYRIDGLYKRYESSENSLSDLRSSIMKYRTEIDQVQEHLAKSRDSLLILSEAVKNPKNIEVRFLNDGRTNEVPNNSRRNKKVSKRKNSPRS